MLNESCIAGQRFVTTLCFALLYLVFRPSHFLDCTKELSFQVEGFCYIADHIIMKASRDLCFKPYNRKCTGQISELKTLVARRLPRKPYLYEWENCCTRVHNKQSKQSKALLDEASYKAVIEHVVAYLERFTSRSEAYYWMIHAKTRHYFNGDCT